MAIDFYAFICRSLQSKSLQLNSLNLVVADLFLHLNLLLVAMLLQLLRTALLGSVLALAAMCLCADWLNSLLLDLVAEFTANNLAVRSVGELLRLLWLSSALHFTHLLGLEVTVLLLLGLREPVCELLTEPGVVGAAHFCSDHSWSFVAVLNWNRSAHSVLAITLRRLNLPAIEVAGLLAHHVVDHGLLVLAGLTVKLDALEVIEGVNSDVKGSVANPLVHDSAQLGVRLFDHSLIFYVFLEATDQFVDVEACLLIC